MLPHHIPGDFMPMRPQDGKHDFIKPKDLSLIPFRIALALQSDGWYVRNDIIWNKQGGKPESVKDRLTQAHEYIFLLTKSKKYYFDYQAIQEPCSGNNTIMKNRRTVWTISVEGQPYKKHIAPFPKDLVSLCIRAGCPPEGIVFDPFCGSGTTPLVAVESGRCGIGMDLSFDYASISNERINNKK